MIPVDDIFLEAIKESHVLSCRINVIQLQGTGASLEQTLVAENVGVISGSVTADSSSNARRTFQAVVPIRSDNTYYDSRDPLTNDPKNLPLNVLDSQVQVFSGVQIGERTVQVPLGVFRVDEVKRRNRDALSISGSSLEVYVVENVETASKTYSKTALVLQTIKDIILDVLPYVEFDVGDDVDSDSEGDPLNTEIGSDMVRDVGSSPWGAIEILGTKIDADVYCGPDGRFKIVKKPSLEDTNPVLTVEAGTIGFDDGVAGTLVERNGGVTRDDTYNAVVVMGQSVDPDVPPVSYVLKISTDEGYAADDPLRWGGPFGKKARVLGQNPVLTSTAACKSAAQTYIKRYQSLSRTLDISMIPNPALEPDDVIRIDMLDGTFENHMIKRIDMPFGIAGSWKIETMSTKQAPDEGESGE